VTCGLLLVWILVWARGRISALGLTTERLGAALGTGLKTLLATMPGIIAALFLATFIHSLVVSTPPGEHPVLQALGKSVNPWQVVAFFALAGLVVPILEELFYRGLIQTALMRSGNAAVAISASAILFGMVHLSLPNGPTSAPAIAVLGFGLGYAYYRTRSLWAPVLMHAMFNLYNLTLTLGAPLLADYLKEQFGG
jgi:membrane protease YdiL (CAAX protease family)